MYRIQAKVQTANASRYLQQLCTHWSHKLDVKFSPREGRVPFNAEAECLLGADESGLDVRINAADASEGSRLGRVVIEHLQRYAFREQLEPPIWHFADNRGA